MLAPATITNQFTSRADMGRSAVHSAIQRAMLGAILLTAAGCGGSKTLMPARVDLAAFQRIGLVEFSSNADGSLQTLASQDFLERLQASQPGVPVLELGNERKVLAAIGRQKLDPDAIQALGKIYNVDAVIIGNVEVTDVEPKVSVSQILTAMDVQADVEASLTTRIMDAGSGATVWTRSARSKETVGHASLDRSGGFHFGASDPEAAYGTLVGDLVYSVTQDFRPYWVSD
jgi:hypothetical protein